MDRRVAHVEVEPGVLVKVVTVPENHPIESPGPDGGGELSVNRSEPFEIRRGPELGKLGGLPLGRAGKKLGQTFDRHSRQNMRQSPKRRGAEKRPETEITPVLTVHEIPMSDIKTPGIHRPAHQDTDRFLLKAHPAGKEPIEMKVMIPFDVEEPHTPKQELIEEGEEFPVLFFEKNRIAHQEIENVACKNDCVPRSHRFSQGREKGTVKGSLGPGQMEVGKHPDPGEPFHQAF
jgi:hypothetical protein